jgi:hypothetical protein
MKTRDTVFMQITKNLQHMFTQADTFLRMLVILSQKLLNYCAKQCTVKQIDKIGHIATLIIILLESKCVVLTCLTTIVKKTCWIYTYELYYMAAGNKRFRERQC